MRARLVCAALLAACNAPSDVGGTAAASSGGVQDDVSYEDGSPVDPPTACDDAAAAHVDPLRRLALTPSPSGSIEAIAVVPGRVYACSELDGLFSWDVADPTAPVLDGHAVGPGCSTVAAELAGDRVVTANATEVSLWQGGPTPSLIATWASEAPVEAVALSEDRVYVATGVSGVHALAVEGELFTPHASYADEASDSRGLAMSEAGVVVAEARGGVRTFDLELVAPIETRAVDGVTVDVAVDGARILAAALDAVVVFEPDADLVVIDTPGTAVAVATTSEVPVVADWTGVRRLNASRVSASERLVSPNPLARFADIAAVGDIAYATDGAELLSLRVTSEAAPNALVRDTRLDFIDLDAGESKARAMTIRNEGDADLVICDVHTNLPEAGVDVRTGVVAPGDTLTVELSIEGQSDAPWSGNITVVSNDPDRPEFSVPAFANPDRIDTGEPMAPFHLMGVDGRSLSSDDLQGKVALLTYFATW